MKQVEELLDAGRADPGAAAECEKRLLELKLELDKAANSLEWPALTSEARDWLAWLQKVADQHGTDKQRQRASELAAEVEKITSERNADRLRKVKERIGRLYFEIVSTQADWWMYQFQQAEKEQHKMIDQERAARLINQGRDYVSKNNLAGLQNVMKQLWIYETPAGLAPAGRELCCVGR